MAVAFNLNGLDAKGVQCEWSQQVLRNNTDGTFTYSTFASHTWNIDKMLATDYVNFRGLRGGAVVLTTNDIDTRNNSKTYSGAILESIEGNQDGHIMRNVNFVFRVDVVT